MEEKIMEMWSGTDNNRPSIYRVPRKGSVNMPMTSNEPEEATPANHIPGPKQGEWTYSHYAALPDDGNRYEIIDGVLYMAPAPFGPHQRIVVHLVHYLCTYVENKGLGLVYTAPFDVELGPGTSVQPDVTVLLHSNKRASVPSRMKGAPDLVVEVLSPNYVKFDRQKKYQAYAQAGITEYWIVDPKAYTIEVFTLKDGDYQCAGIFSGEQFIQSKVIPDFPVQARRIFHMLERPANQ
jgi:Uma2 family endonuclease